MKRPLEEVGRILREKNHMVIPVEINDWDIAGDVAKILVPNIKNRTIS